MSKIWHRRALAKRGSTGGALGHLYDGGPASHDPASALPASSGEGTVPIETKKKTKRGREAAKTDEIRGRG